MGSYCKFCDRRCFVLRVIPDGPCAGWTGHLATCKGGMAHDLKETGHTHLTAVNPVTDPEGAAAIRRSVDTCWADPLNRAERAELARMLARHCKKFWDAVEVIGAQPATYRFTELYAVPAVAVVVHPPLPRVLYRNALRPRPVPEEVVRRQHRLVTDALNGLAGEGFERVIMAGPDGWPFDLEGDH